MNTSPRYSVAGFLDFGISKLLEVLGSYLMIFCQGPPLEPWTVHLTLVKYLKKWSTTYGLDTILKVLLAFYSWYCSSNHHQASKRCFLGSLADLSRNIYIHTHTHFIDMLGNIFFHTTGPLDGDFFYSLVFVRKPTYGWGSQQKHRGVELYRQE